MNESEKTTFVTSVRVLRCSSNVDCKSSPGASILLFCGKAVVHVLLLAEIVHLLPFSPLLLSEWQKQNIERSHFPVHLPSVLSINSMMQYSIETNKTVQPMLQLRKRTR